MGAGQFLRDFRRDFTIEKDMAHRKAVTSRKQLEEKKKVPLDDIKNYQSPMRRALHAGLLALVTQLKDRGLMKLFKKSELQQLCWAYATSFPGSSL